MINKDIQIVENSSTIPFDVWFEPWGMTHTLQPQEAFRVIAQSDHPGQLEIVHTSINVIVYGWQGCTMQVFKGSDIIDDFDTTFPELPSSMSVKSFVEFMFGRP